MLKKLIVEVIEEKYLYQEQHLYQEQQSCLILGMDKNINDIIKNYCKNELANYNIDYYREADFEESLLDMSTYNVVLLYQPSLELISKINYILLDNKILRQLFQRLKDKKKVKIIFNNKDSYLKGYSKVLQDDINKMIEHIKGLGISIIEIQAQNIKILKKCKRLITFEDAVKLFDSGEILNFKDDIILTPMAKDFIQSKKSKLNFKKGDKLCFMEK